ncbi:MAG: CinA family nicotinamide mononucleotide deamidase-related protein [Marinilabiliales bacterium]
MKAEIINIGNELLAGQVVNSNAQWIAEQLQLLNIPVYQITTISDTPQHIINALELSLKTSDLIIITGGLGPTSDDITKKVIANYFDSKLVFSQDVYNHIELLLKTKGINKINDFNKEQALIPENSKIFKNKYGTAPGLLFEKNNKKIICLPGVPFEMKQIFSEQIIDYLTKNFKLNPIEYKIVMIQGIFESELSDKLKDWETDCKKNNISVAYLPQPGLIRLKLSALGNSNVELQEKIQKEIDKLFEIIPDNIYGFDEEMPYENIGKILKDRKKTIVTAESCTGGKIASLITSVPGSSEYYNGSIIAYSNKVKQEILNIPADIIEKHGAVSKEVVELMAINVRKLLNADYSIATSGIAGPGGGTVDKPVGTTWIAVCAENNCISKKYLMGNLRLINIQKTSFEAFALLRKLILQDS